MAEQEKAAIIKPAATSLDTAVPVLGPAALESPCRQGRFVADESRVLMDLDPVVACNTEVPAVSFEQAGPRQKIFFEPGKTKCAIVTCGGLCPGINDVIRAIVLEAYHNYGVPTVLGIRYGLEGFIPSHGHEVVDLTPKEVSHIHQFGGTVLGSSRGPQSIEDIVDALERLNVDILFMLGGDGTMRAAKAIQAEIAARKLAIALVAVPKTIDNDIPYVSTTFGFDSAVEKATEAITCAHIEATGAPNGIGLVKVMGRESGFIAAQAAMAQRDVDFVLIPEDQFTLDGPSGLLAALERRLSTRGHAVIVVAEGAGQHLLQISGDTDASGNPVLGDIAGLLKRRIGEFFKSRGVDLTLKYIDPSYLIRSIPANSNDSIYCGFLGQNAVHAAMAGKTGMLISRWNAHYVHMPLTLVTSAERRRRIDTGSNYWRSVLESTGQMAYFEPGKS